MQDFARQSLCIKFPNTTSLRHIQTEELKILATFGEQKLLTINNGGTMKKKSIKRLILLEILALGLGLLVAQTVRAEAARAAQPAAQKASNSGNLFEMKAEPSQIPAKCSRNSNKALFLKTQDRFKGVLSIEDGENHCIGARISYDDDENYLVIETEEGRVFRIPLKQKEGEGSEIKIEETKGVSIPD